MPLISKFTVNFMWYNKLGCREGGLRLCCEVCFFFKYIRWNKGGGGGAAVGKLMEG